MTIILRCPQERKPGYISCFSCYSHFGEQACAALPPTPSPRASILEMRKDHEAQLQRLKLLKDREIENLVQV